MRGHPSISPVYKRGQEPDDRDPLDVWGRIETMKRKAWRDHGTIAVKPCELPDGLRRQMEEWATDHYGARNGRT